MAPQKKRPRGGGRVRKRQRAPKIGSPVKARPPKPPIPSGPPVSGSQSPGSTRPGSSKPGPKRPTPVEVVVPGPLRKRPAKPVGPRPTSPKPPSLKPIVVAPGKPAGPKLIGAVVAEVNSIYVRGALETALAVARVVVEQLLGGDETRLAAGESEPALQELAAHEDLRVPPPTLWTALAVYEQVQLLPGELVALLPLSHHRILLGVPQVKAKVRIAKRSVVEELSQGEIQEAVTRWRARQKLPLLGRPPQDPAIVASRRMATAALRLEQAIDEKRPTEEPRRQILRKLALTEKRIQRIREDLE